MNNSARFDIFDIASHVLGAWLVVAVLVLASTPSAYVLLVNVSFWYLREGFQRSPAYSFRRRWLCTHWGANKNAEWIAPAVLALVPAILIHAFLPFPRFWF